MCEIEEYNGNKLQFLDVNILVDEWTEGRWARPIESLWENKLNPDCDIVVFPIQKYNIYKRKMTIKRICKYCGREFTPNGSKQTMCGFCFKINSCDMCGKVFLTQHKGFKKSDESRNTFCSHECSRKFACSKMQEWYNEHHEKRSELCYNNHNNYSGIKYCEKCGKETYHLVGAGCVVCHNRTESKRESSRINMTNLWKNEEFKKSYWNIKYCEKCGKETQHKFFTCLECFPDSLGAPMPNFIDENPNCEKHPDCLMKFWDRRINKYICWYCYKEEFEKDFSLYIPKNCICKQCGNICESGKMFCSEECKEKYYQEHKKLFRKMNDNKKCYKHPEETLIYGYKCWSCYQEKFESLNNCSFINEISNFYPNAFIQSTFRTQESDDWTGARNAFERSLIEKNLNYFVYIKFYVKDNNHLDEFYPLVVGKSGSYNVNNSSDVSFSTDINDGPARKFLSENNYNWLKTNILIISTENETEALNIEKEICNKYNLFYS